MYIYISLSLFPFWIFNLSIGTNGDEQKKKREKTVTLNIINLFYEKVNIIN